jgi:hypothetical protein
MLRNVHIAGVRPAYGICLILDDRANVAYTDGLTPEFLFRRAILERPR